MDEASVSVCSVVCLLSGLGVEWSGCNVMQRQGPRARLGGSVNAGWLRALHAVSRFGVAVWVLGPVKSATTVPRSMWGRHSLVCGLPVVADNVGRDTVSPSV